MPTLEVNTNVHGGATNNAGPSTPAPPPLGTLIDDGTDAGALQLTSVLGYGGYGVVYRASAPTGTLYAVKCLLRTSNANNPKQQQRQRRLHMREIALHRLAGAGAHPGIVRLHRVIEPALPAADGSLTLPSPYTFLVMDFAPCGDLFTLILHKQVYLGRTGLVARVFAQLAAAVSHCHSLGIFHRDLKPENVLCWDGGETVRLADFGLATTERRSKEWRTGSVYHMSPECQNGNSASAPYSPLANDIWSLAILLLNLLTARNPWARASPSDPTFSAYLSSPRYFLPQVLPISSGLNDVLARALDVQWERRESFGVDGLAEGVARLSVEADENQYRRLGYLKPRKTGLYATDVVFEGGMARCPWEVGMHIPSGSSGSEGDANTHHIRIPPELEPPKPEVPPKNTKANVKTSSASFGTSVRQSPTVSMMVEMPPPPTPAKDVHPSRWNAEATRGPVVETRLVSKSSDVELTSAKSEKEMVHEDEASMSEIRFAEPSNAGGSSPSSSDSSASSSEVSSLDSVCSETRGSGEGTVAHEPYISESNVTGETEAYVYEYAAVDPETPIEEKSRNSRFVEYQPRPAHQPSDYNSSRRSHRYRGRSRGRQPYPQVHNQSRTSVRSRQRKPKPELKLNVDLPSSFLHLRKRDSSRPRGSSTRSQTRTRTRTPSPTVSEVRRQLNQERFSSSPFAFSVSSRFDESVADPHMDVDSERRVLRSTDPDVHMLTPSTAAADAGEESDRVFAFRSSRPRRSSNSSGFLGRESATPSSGSVTSGSTGGRRRRTLVVRTSSRSSGDSARSETDVDSNGRSIVRIDRSALNTATTETGPEFVVSGSASDRSARSSEAGSVTLHDPYAQPFARSASPSASSSLFRQNGTPRVPVSGDSDDLGDNMDAEMFDFGRDEILVSSQSSEKSGPEGVAWANELRRVVQSVEGAGQVDDGIMMETDDCDVLPSLPGSFPSSPIDVDSRRQSRVLQIQPSPIEPRGNLGLELFTRASGLHNSLVQRGDSRVSVESERPLSQAGSLAPPPSVRSRTNSADEALRALHAFAIESNPWHGGAPHSSGWEVPVASQSSTATQTFMAITTDSSHPYRNAASETNDHDFREYTNYLRYVDSGLDEVVGQSTPSARPASITPSDHSFRARTSNGRPHSFRSGTSSVHHEEPVHEQPVADSFAHRRSRSRTRSFLKFVSKRPFSSSGPGFVPRRSRSPSLALDANKGIASPGFTFGTNSPARFSFTLASDGGSTVIVERDIPDMSSVALAETMAKLTCASPTVAAVSAIFTIEKEPSLPSPQRHNTAPTPVKLPAERFSFLSKEPRPTPTKQRTWSFTHHSRTHRRSRSVSPPPSRGTARDVLFRLRSARNWFWSALSGMGSGGSSATRHGRAGKGSRWGPLRSPLVGLAA